MFNPDWPDRKEACSLPRPCGKNEKWIGTKWSVMKCSLTSQHRLIVLCNMILQCNYCLLWALVFTHPFTQEMADKCLPLQYQVRHSETEQAALASFCTGSGVSKNVMEDKESLDWCWFPCFLVCVEWHSQSTEF